MCVITCRGAVRVPPSPKSSAGEDAAGAAPYAADPEGSRLQLGPGSGPEKLPAGGENTVACHRNPEDATAMNIMSELGRIVREESAPIEPTGLLREAWSIYPKDKIDEMIRYWLEGEAGTAGCNSRVARLPLRQPVPYVGTRAGPFQEQGIVFSGWRGAYSFAELHGILNNVAIPGMSAQDQGTT
jgi:hypothetical protein